MQGIANITSFQNSSRDWLKVDRCFGSPLRPDNWPVQGCCGQHIGWDWVGAEHVEVSDLADDEGVSVAFRVGNITNPEGVMAGELPVIVVSAVRVVVIALDTARAGG